MEQETKRFTMELVCPCGNRRARIWGTVSDDICSDCGRAFWERVEEVSRIVRTCSSWWGPWEERREVSTVYQREPNDAKETADGGEG